jgi:hypothetical protein
LVGRRRCDAVDFDAATANATGGSVTITGGSLIGRLLANVAITMTGTNIHGSCALLAQGTASCTVNDNDDNDEHHHEKDKDQDHDKDRDKDKDKDHEKEKDRDR